MTCKVNQWTVFYMISTSVVKELNWLSIHSYYKIRRKTEFVVVSILPLNGLNTLQIPAHIYVPNPEAYPEPCQASEFLEKHLMAFSSWQFSRKAPLTCLFGS